MWPGAVWGRAGPITGHAGPPTADQSVAEWCQQAHCRLVGCYEHGGQRMVFTAPDDPRAAQFNPKKVRWWRGLTVCRAQVRGSLACCRASHASLPAGGEAGQHRASQGARLCAHLNALGIQLVR